LIILISKSSLLMQILHFLLSFPLFFTLKEVMQVKYALVLALLLVGVTHAQDVLIPLPDSTRQQIVYPGFTLQYNEQHEQADWVAYRLDSLELIPVVKRQDRFKSDPNVITGSASLSDYKSSGYDRGHLAPAADMRFSEETMLQSFFMSNMSPQLPEFNRGIWKKLEETVRDFAKENLELYIVTGPVLRVGLTTIGENEVSVPELYYKALCELTPPEIKMIAFLLPNQGSTAELQTFSISVDSLEKITGLDFFYILPDRLEESLESECNPEMWFDIYQKDRK